jgi:hypothetical protein
MCYLDVDKSGRHKGRDCAMATHLRQDTIALNRLGYGLIRKMGRFVSSAVAFSVISILTGSIRPDGYMDILAKGTIFWMAPLTVFQGFNAPFIGELASGLPLTGCAFPWRRQLDRRPGWFGARVRRMGWWTSQVSPLICGSGCFGFIGLPPPLSPVTTSFT